MQLECEGNESGSDEEIVAEVYFDNHDLTGKIVHVNNEKDEENK